MVFLSLTHDLSTSVMDGISKIGKRFIMYSTQVRTIVPANPFAVKFNFLPYCPVQSRDFFLLFCLTLKKYTLLTTSHF